MRLKSSSKIYSSNIRRISGKKSIILSQEEAGKYLETYKAFEYKQPDMIMEKVQDDYLSRVMMILLVLDVNNIIRILVLFINIIYIYILYIANSLYDTNKISQ